MLPVSAASAVYEDTHDGTDEQQEACRCSACGRVSGTLRNGRVETEMLM
jgi:hypothetical protein